jgi:hypothetical protein
MKRLVLMGEGDGERESLPVLVKRLFQGSAPQPWDVLFLDTNVITLGDLSSLLNQTKQGNSDRTKWSHRLRHAAKRPNLGGVLVVLDGDAKRRTVGTAFCAQDHARQLISLAKSSGAGTLFSLAIAFACKEYESWLIAGVESLAGKPLREGLEGIAAGTKPPNGNLEEAPRDAKGWLSDRMKVKYKPVRDQSYLTELVDLQLVRDRPMRSFRRLENALSQLANAIRTNQAISTPE